MLTLHNRFFSTMAGIVLTLGLTISAWLSLPASASADDTSVFQIAQRAETPLVIKSVRLTATPGSTIQGTSPPNARIQIMNGQTSLGSTTANASGTWSLSVGSTLEPGTYALRVVSRDPVSGTVQTAMSDTYDLRANGVAQLKGPAPIRSADKASDGNAETQLSKQQRLERRADQLGLLASERFERFLDRLQGREQETRTAANTSDAAQKPVASKPAASSSEASPTDSKEPAAKPDSATKDQAVVATKSPETITPPSVTKPEPQASTAPAKPKPSEDKPDVNTAKQGANDLWDAVTGKPADTKKPTEQGGSTETSGQKQPADTSSEPAKPSDVASASDRSKSDAEQTAAGTPEKTDKPDPASQPSVQPDQSVASKSANDAAKKEPSSAGTQSEDRVASILQGARDRLRKLLETKPADTAPSKPEVKSTDRVEQEQGGKDETAASPVTPKVASEAAPDRPTATEEPEKKLALNKQDEATIPALPVKRKGVTPPNEAAAEAKPDAAPAGDTPSPQPDPSPQTGKATGKVEDAKSKTEIAAKADTGKAAKAEALKSSDKKPRRLRAGRIPARLARARLRVRRIEYQVSDTGRGRVIAAGRGRPGARIALRIGGRTIATRTVSRAGRWSLRTSYKLPSGITTARIRMRDPGTGNVQTERFEFENRPVASSASRRRAPAAQTNRELRKRYIRTPAPRAGRSAPAGDRFAGRYIVQQGDTLQSIAGQVYGDPGQWRSLLRANQDRIGNPNQIYAGQALRLN